MIPDNNNLADYPADAALRLRTALTDNELVVSAFAGNEAAFAELFARHRRMLARVVRRYFQQADDVDELVHISFIEAWTGMGAYRGSEPHSFAAWLARIAINSCYDELRRRRRNREDTLSQFGGTESDFCLEKLSADQAMSHLESSVVTRDLTSKLLALLDPTDRLIFVMLKAHSYSIAEIAQLVGWSEARVKMRLHRTRCMLQRRSRRFA